MRKSRLNAASIVVCGVLVLGGAGAAYAYWTTNGTGAGTGATGTAASIVATQTSSVTAMGPGVAAQELSGTFNNGNDGPAFVARVTASIGSVTGGAGACDATDYTLTNPAMDVNASVPAGTNQGAWGVPADVATIAFNNKATNQDGCKNATVSLVYTIS